MGQDEMKGSRSSVEGKQLQSGTRQHKFDGGKY